MITWYEITWVVEYRSQVEEIGDYFKKVTLLLSDWSKSDKKPTLAVEFQKDNIKMLTGISKWDTVKIICDVSSREWNGKFFTTVIGTAVLDHEVEDMEDMPF